MLPDCRTPDATFAIPTFDVTPNDVEGFVEELWEFQSVFHDCFARSESHAVWLKYCVASRCLSMIVAEQATEALPPHHVPRVATHCPLPCDQLVVETLMIALVMIMGQVLLDRIIQGAFPSMTI
jgi:hypothetical protein